MDWSLGLESWSGVLEWNLGVESWSEILSVVENSISVVTFVSGQTYPIIKCIKMYKLYELRISNRNEPFVSFTHTGNAFVTCFTMASVQTRPILLVR